MLRSWSICVLFCMVACETPQDLRVADLELKFTGAASCAPSDGVDRVVVEALGDFPASDGRTIEILRPGDEPGVIDRFPVNTAALVVTASSPRWEGIGIRFASERETSGRLLLVPADLECSLADPELAFEGSALVPFPDGGLFAVGGQRGEQGLRRLLILEPGSVLASRATDLSVRRLGMAAIRVGTRLLVAGGALGTTGPGHDTYEVFDRDGVQLAFGTLLGPRREAAAVALDETRVLLVGGRETAEGDALTRVEEVDVGTGAVRELAPLPIARSGVRLVRTDDGAILAIGGHADNGNPVGDVFAYDPANDEWQTILPVRLPALPGLGATVLPGGRVVVWASSIPGRPSSTLRVIRRVPPFLSGIPALEYEDVAIGSAPALIEVAATALPDGRLFMSGVDGEGRSRSLALDLGRQSVEELPTLNQAATVVTLADGLVFAAGLSGASVRRPVALTPLHQPPATLLAEDFALDAPGRWIERPVGLGAAVDGARAEIAALRFADFSIELAASGEVDLLLLSDGSAPARIVFNNEEFGPPLCTLERTGPERIRITRRGTELRLSQGDRERVCALTGLATRVGLGFIAQAGATIDAVAITRL